MKSTTNQNKMVAVIGAGAGGLPAAVALAEQGIHVQLIERGDALKTESIATNRYDYELNSTPWNKYASEWRGPVELQQGRGLGGSTLYFQGVSQVPDDSVMQSWGLPIEEVNKLYKEVVEYLQIAGEVQSAHKLNPVSEYLFDRAKGLGWNVRQAPVAILSKKHGNRPACNHCGLCIYGCRLGDKSSVDKTWLLRAKRSGKVEILTNTQVDSLVLSDKKRVNKINISSQKKAFSIHVDAVVIASGVLETPYLLRTSQQKLAPNGIGNKNVGRYLTDSLWQSLLVSVPGNLKNGHAGIPTDIHIEEFVNQGILLYQNRNMAGITGPVTASRYLLSNKYNGDIRDWMRRYYQNLAGLGAYAESSTTFNDGLIESNVKEFRKSINDTDADTITNMRTKLLQWSDAAKVQILSQRGNISLPISGAMLRGTCRMGKDPEYSATNSDGLLWEYDNIYISDSSIIARGMIANPSLLLQILGLHIGRKCAQQVQTA